MLIYMLTGLAVSGSVAAAACLLVRKAARGRLSARWEYRMAKLSLVFALVPLGPLFSWVGRLQDTFWGLSMESTVSSPAVQAPVQTGTAGGLPLAPLEFSGAPALGKALALPQWVLVLAVGVWGLGALWMLVRKLRARRALVRLVRSSRPVTEEAVPETLRHCRELLGLRQQVAVRTSAAVASPLVTGLVHPVILLPETALEPQALKCLLLHELDHVRRSDLWVRLCSMAALVIHWYNPLFHMLDRTVREVGEERCDEDVAVLLDRRERLRYGRILLQMAAGNPGQAGPWALCLTSREALERRLKKLLDTTPMKGRKRLLALLAAVAVLSCGTAAALSFRGPLVTAEPKEPAVQTAPQREKAPAEAEDPETTAPQEDPGVTAPQEEVRSQAETSSTEETAPQDETPSEQTAVSQPEAATQTSQPEEPAISQELQVIMETALRGDPDLIVSRGGTLLPDDDRESYCQINEAYYKLYVDKNGVYRMEYWVGNRDALDEFMLPLSDALVDGVFPTNSLGESYGSSGLTAYVGYEPDLGAAIGTNGKEGYICDEDRQSVPHNLPASECPHEFMIPLYDSEHNVIGEFSMSCGGHFSGGMTIEEAKAALAAGEDLS